MKSKKLRYLFVVAGLLVLGLLLVRSAFRVSQAQAQSGSQLPAFGHVVFVTLEDHSYSQVVATQSDGVTPVCPAPANAPMPNLQALICSQGLATKYYADTHPAIGDYFTLASGQILTNNDNYIPGSAMSCSDSSSVACSQGGLGYQSVANIASELEAAYGAGSWKGYVECIPYAGYTTSTAIQTCPSGVPNSSDHYYTYHDILAYLTNVTQTNRVPFYDPSTGAGFAHDVSAGTLPPFSFIGPDGCDDAHDCSLSTADNWLQNKVVTPLQQSRYFQSNGDGLLIITFDEDNNTNNDGCALQTGTDCGGQIATVIVSPYIIRQNYLQTSGDPHNANGGYEPQNVLRLMAQGLGLTTYPGDSATANNMSEFFTLAPVTASPSSLTFSSRYLNTTSPAQTVTLSNPQTTALSIASIAFTGSNPADFGQTNNCGSSLAAGATCTINVTFTPTGINARSAALAITDNAGNSPQTVSLTGTGINPGATLSPSSLTFSSRVVGTTSANQTITLTNTGTTTLSISSISISGDFAETNNCGSSVTAGSACAINVIFTPTATGTRTGTLTVSDNASNSPQTAALTGTGVVATCSGPAFVQVKNNIDTSNTAHTSLSVNITTAAGDLLVAFVRESSNGTDNFTVTDSAGQHWTPTASGYKNESGTGPRIGMFYMANSASVTSVTANFTTSGGVIKPGVMVMEVSGAAASGVFDGSVSNASGASVGTSSSGSLSTTNANDILIFATDTGNNETGWTAGTGYAIPNNNLMTGASGSNARQAIQYKFVSSLQANATTSTTYTPSNWNGNIFAAFKGATSAGGSSPPVLVQVQNKIDTGSSAFTSFSVNITTQPGDLLVAFVRESSNGTDNFTVTDSAGQTWTQTASGYKSESGTGPRIGMFYTANSTAVTSVTAHYTTSGGVIKPGVMVMEISGAASSSVGDGAVNNASGASVTTSSSGSLSTTNASDILIFATDTSGDESGWTAGSGYAIPNNNLTTGGNGSNVRQAMQYKIVSSVQSGAATTMTYAGANWNGNIFAAFKANCSGGSMVANAGPNQTIQLPTTTATLTGSVSNACTAGCTLTSQWTQVSGPGTVSFANAWQPVTTATFPAIAGAYVLQLTWSNSYGTSSAQVTITVTAPAASYSLALTPAIAGPNVAGTTQAMTAVVTSGAGATPVSGATVTFTVTGPNAPPPPVPNRDRERRRDRDVHIHRDE